MVNKIKIKWPLKKLLEIKWKSFRWKRMVKEFCGII